MRRSIQKTGLVSAALIFGVAGGYVFAQASNRTLAANSAQTKSTQGLVNLSHVSWILPSKHPGRLWPIYNENLSINYIKGRPPLFNHWKVPVKWKPYIWAAPYKEDGRHRFLFITLQGTVFLYPFVAQSGWPIGPFANIPPSATIVAEYVPLKPAVEAGILPVYNGEVFLATGIPMPPVWLKALGIKKTPS